MIIKQSQFAEHSIVQIAEYISVKGYPETAVKYIQRLQFFIESLATFPPKYPICKQPQFAKNNFHCAVFEKTYVVVYKITTDTLYIYHIIHGSRLA